MDIHKIYGLIFKIWRQKRMIKFESIIKPSTEDFVLDVGGYPPTWTVRPQLSGRIDCLNLHQVDFDNRQFPDHSIVTSIGDACDLKYDNNSFDILFSNSVIEHVGDWEKQKAFAKEVRRVGKKLWIQTPALGCPIEPHYLAPFVHWLPIYIRRRILRWATPWGWISKPTQNEIDENIAFTQLLSKKQVRELFPDCVIITERLLGVFPKSYTAYRVNS